MTSGLAEEGAPRVRRIRCIPRINDVVQVGFEILAHADSAGSRDVSSVVVSP
jgi:hypothetical protein